MAGATKKAPPENRGEIRKDSLYTLREFQDRSGLGQAALRTARRNGLKIKRIGRRGYVYGADAIAYFESLD